MAMRKNRPGSLVAGAPAAATTAAASGKPSRRLGGNAVARPVRGRKNRKLYRVPLARALRAGNLLLLVEHDLLKVRLAIFANVFVNRHGNIIPYSALKVPRSPPSRPSGRRPHAHGHFVPIPRNPHCHPDPQAAVFHSLRRGLCAPRASPERRDLLSLLRSDRTACITFLRPVDSIHYP